MEIRIRNTGEVMTDITFRDTFRDRVLPAQLTEEWLNGFAGGCDVVFEGPQPTPDNRYQSVIRQGVEEIEGKWFTKYVLVEPDAEGKAAMDANRAEQTRLERNRLLSNCDWTQVADSPVDKAAWATYRQALRDITAQSGFPWSVEWPTQP
jgi:hypothetical protein